MRQLSSTVFAGLCAVALDFSLMASGPAAVGEKVMGCEPHWDNAVGQPGTNSAISALAVVDASSRFGQLSTGLYVGGAFVEAGGQLVNRIARWEGAHWSALGKGMNGQVRALAVFDDGSGGGPALYAGGTFTTVGSVNASRIAKWDGSQWSPLGSGLGGWGAITSVFALAVFDDGSGAGEALYVGGRFTEAGGKTVNHIAKWDGSGWSPLGSGMNTRVHALAVFDDGRGPALYAGGLFTIAGDQPATYIAKWNGSEWSAVGGGVGFGDVRAFSVFNDSSGGGEALYVGGSFTTAGGLPAERVARWDGAQWTPLGSGLGGEVSALSVFDDHAGGGPALYAGGTFPTADKAIQTGIKKWDGSLWLSLGTTGAVWAIAVFDDEFGAPELGPSLYAAGTLTAVGCLPTSRIARWGCTLSGPAVGDLDGDGCVGLSDLLILLGAWGLCPNAQICPGDLTGDGAVGVADLLVLLANWG